MEWILCRHVRKWCFIIFVTCTPTASAEAIFINEVAWMGAAESANHEWIELHNPGAEQDVSGWQLSDGNNLEIELTGTIPAGAYAVLERTSEASALGNAFLIYTGALVNTGATLTLRDAAGNVVDQVAGGEDWENIGGDNDTKATAQYTSGGWVTAAPTPGFANAETSDISPEAEASANDNSNEDETETAEAAESLSRSSAAGETVRLELPDVTLQLMVDGQSVGYVNQPITFTVEPSGIGKTLIDSLQYQWNFGDGTQADTQETAHTFVFPGEYVVTVHAGYGRQEQVARHQITILPTTLALVRMDSGVVQLHNDAPYEIDISGFTVRGERVFTFPPYSLMLPNQTITLTQRHIGPVHNQMLAAYDAAGSMVASVLPERLVKRVAADEGAVAEASKTPPPPRPTILNYTAQPPEPLRTAPTATLTSVTPVPFVRGTSTQTAALAAAPLPPHWSSWLFGLLLLSATLLVLLAPRRNENA